MKKTELTAEDIYNKEFNISLEGYNPEEVDNVLDLVISDYQTMQNRIQELEIKLSLVENELAETKEELLHAESKVKFNDFSHTTQYSSVDLLKRVSRLEEEILKNK